MGCATMIACGVPGNFPVELMCCFLLRTPYINFSFLDCDSLTITPTTPVMTSVVTV